MAPSPLNALQTLNVSRAASRNEQINTLNTAIAGQTNNDDASIKTRVTQQLEKGKLLLEQNKPKEALASFQAIERDITRLPFAEKQTTEMLAAQLDATLLSGQALLKMNQPSAAADKYAVVIDSLNNSGNRNHIAFTDEFKQGNAEQASIDANLGMANAAQALKAPGEAFKHLEKAYYDNPSTDTEFKHNTDIARRAENIAKKAGKSVSEAHQNKAAHEQAEVDNSQSALKKKRHSLKSALERIGSNKANLGTIMPNKLRFQPNLAAPKATIPNAADTIVKLLTKVVDDSPSSLALMNGEVSRGLGGKITDKVRSMITEGMRDNVAQEALHQAVEKKMPFALASTAFQVIAGLKTAVDKVSDAEEAIKLLQNTMQGLYDVTPSREESAQFLSRLMDTPSSEISQQTAALTRMATTSLQNMVQQTSTVQLDAGTTVNEAINQHINDGKELLAKGNNKAALASFQEAEKAHRALSPAAQHSEQVKSQLSDIHLGSGNALLGLKLHGLAENRFNQIIDQHDKQQTQSATRQLISAFVGLGQQLDTSELTVAKAYKGLAQAKELDASKPGKSDVSQKQFHNNALAMLDKAVIKEPEGREAFQHNVEIHTLRKQMAQKLKAPSKDIQAIDKSIQEAKAQYQAVTGEQPKAVRPPPADTSEKSLGAKLVTNAYSAAPTLARPEKKVDKLPIMSELANSLLADETQKAKVMSTVAKEIGKIIGGKEESDPKAIHAIVGSVMTNVGGLIKQVASDPLMKNALERTMGIENANLAESALGLATETAKLYREQGKEGIIAGSK